MVRVNKGDVHTHGRWAMGLAVCVTLEGLLPQAISVLLFLQRRNIFSFLCLTTMGFTDKGETLSVTQEKCTILC